MHIEKVDISGFRLLEENIEMMLETKTTVIVGRNNSGKTSLTELFDRFAGTGGATFRLEDFSAGTRTRFLDAREKRLNGSPPDVVLSILPTISVTLTLRYGDGELGPLAPFIIDLDAACKIAQVKIDYAPTLKSMHLLFEVPSSSDENGAGTGSDPEQPKGIKYPDEVEQFYRSLKESIPKVYAIQVTAIDPGDSNNERSFDGTAELAAMVQCDFVRAQRTLDHAKHGDPNVIGKQLGDLYKTATSTSSGTSDNALALKLKASVHTIERGIQTDFDQMLKGLLPALEVFGFPSLNDTELRPETTLDVKSLLSDHTKIVYAGTDGVHLPEGYNGLGTRNLIYMLLQLEGAHKAYRAREIRPVTHLIFIEEPEAHLHPQMQEVFISQLTSAVEKLSEAYPGEPKWPAQFVVSTHSSHVANTADFDAIRYFLSEASSPGGPRKAKVKDFKKGLAKVPDENRRFLHQYMSLTKCDLYFADKAVLIEGSTERILMPRIVQAVDQNLVAGNKLASQYISVIEVGGAYAHLFYDLIDFLEVKTLVVTDLDSVRETTSEGGKKTWTKCPVADGARSSNEAIKSWFRRPNPPGTSTPAGSSPTLNDLSEKTAQDKTTTFRRIAYQVPEIGSSECARSFEDAFILANPKLFSTPALTTAKQAWDAAQKMSKAETALKYAILEPVWTVPRYLAEGLEWLSLPTLAVPSSASATSLAPPGP